MTTWCVVKDDTQETSRRGRYFQYAIFALAALLVVSLGFMVIPREPSPPAALPFSEQARARAFTDSLALRATGLGLEAKADANMTAPQAATVARVVTLLAVQAEALMLPAEGAGDPAFDSAVTASATAQAAVPSSSSTIADLAAALQASGAQRLRDAETADGGMARLLAGAGTAQLLAAEDLASATGIQLAQLPGAGPTDATVPNTTVPDAALPGAALPGGAGSDPSTSPSGSCFSGSSSTGADLDPDHDPNLNPDLGAALALAVERELELVYAYRAALTRLDSGSAVPASDFLSQHGALRADAEAIGRSRCAEMPLRQPGYALSQAFLADPAAALGALEAGALPVLGDVVALSAGPERVWAIAELQAAARRTVYWGASPGPVPGVLLNDAALPPLPETAPTRP